MIYADKPTTLEALKVNIDWPINGISPEIFWKVVKNWTDSMRFVTSSRGGHMPEIILKKNINGIEFIGLATKSFRSFPLDDFSRSNSFFSIVNFRPYMVFDSWRFIDYSVNKKFPVMLFIFCFALIWNEDSRPSFSSHFTLLLPKR